MTKKSRNGRFPPFSLRLSFDERAQIERDAGNMALGAYIREKLLTAPEDRKYQKQPVRGDRTAVSQLLGLLGKSDLAKNLLALNKAAASGSLLLTPDTEKQIRESYAEIMWMRSLLVKALGFERPRGRRSDS